MNIFFLVLGQVVKKDVNLSVDVMRVNLFARKDRILEKSVLIRRFHSYSFAFIIFSSLSSV